MVSGQMLHSCQWWVTRSGVRSRGTGGPRGTKPATGTGPQVLAQQSVGESLVPWPSPYDPSYTIFLATGQDATAEEMFA
eukprot:1237961-Rhodomonas_salina.1